MKPLVELISAWDDFTALKKTTPVSVKEFCEFYLANQSPIKNDEKSPLLDQAVAKVIGRLGAMHKTYSKIAFWEIPGVEWEWYFLLHTINEAKEVRKTDVTSFNLFLEPTTCIDIINRMIKAGLVNEKIDPSDKRARLLTVSEKGILLFTQLQKLIDQTNSMLYGHLAIEDKEYIIKLLKEIEIRHAHNLLNTTKKRS